jgi:imidazolonepropionase-like amidohydrolase
MKYSNATRAALLTLTILSLASLSAFADGVYAIKGAKIYTLAGDPIENGTVVIRDGKIAAVGTDVAVPTDAEVIDAAGLEVHAGIFDAVSRLGLTEVGSVPATNDTTELGEYNPQLIAAGAVYPPSEHIPVARANGITHTATAPGSGGGGFGGGGGYGISGQATLMNLAGWTVEEMTLEKSVGMMMGWPNIQTRTFDFATFSMKEKPFKEVKKDYDDKVAELEEWLDAARHYHQAVERGSTDRFERDLKLEALVPVVQGEMPVIIFAQDKRQIEDAVKFCEEQKLRMILAGGAESWKVKELLKEKNIPVILGPTQALPRHEDDPYDKPYTTAAELQAAGVKIAFATFGSGNSRTLPYEVGTAVGFGLPWEEGLKAITLNPAQILGVDDKLGSIEEGKIANLIVTSGDPLEITTQMKYLFIGGKLTSMDNKHLRLYEKYRARR